MTHRAKRVSTDEYSYRGYTFHRSESNHSYWNVFDSEGNGVDTGYSLKHAKQVVDWNEDA